MEEEIDKNQVCPICDSPVDPSERYPNYVCRECAKKARSADGRLLEFYNETISGGFLSFFAGTKERYGSHICFIDEVKCFADEARFGGIVIQSMAD